MSRAREPVRSLINWILGFWALVSVAIAVWFLSINSSAGDWQDVVTIIGVVFVAVCGLAIGLSWLIIRYLVTGDRARAAVATLVPPALIGLVPLILWLS